MKKKFEILFLLSVIVNLFGIYTSNKLVTNFSKPFILIFLLSYFINQSTPNNFKISTLTIGAMCCSLIGDVLLIFEPNNPLFFIGGLISFFIAHFFYALVFYKIFKTNNATFNFWVLPFVLLYYISLLAFLFPHLDDLKIPVILYGFIISTMLLLALQFLFVQQTSFLISIGALFFVLSDTLLAINKFYTPFAYASIFIILTYAFAQYLIVKGLLVTMQQHQPN